MRVYACQTLDPGLVVADVVAMIRGIADLDLRLGCKDSSAIRGWVTALCIRSMICPTPAGTTGSTDRHAETDKLPTLAAHRAGT